LLRVKSKHYAALGVFELVEIRQHSSSGELRRSSKHPSAKCIMLIVYNKKQRTPLKWGKLNKTKSDEQDEQEDLSEG